MPTPDALLGYVVGPFGAVILLIVALYLLLKGRFIAPFYVLETEKEKNKLLEAENKRLHTDYVELRVQVAEQNTEIKGLRERVEILADIARTQKEPPEISQGSL